MRKITIEHMRRIKKAVPLIEDRVKISVSFQKNSVTVKGPELNEFLVEKMITAIDFGFHHEDALLLTRDDHLLEFIDIKEHTRRKNLKDVRARIIGTGGKARKTIEKLTGSVIVIHENRIGVITDDNHLDAVTQGIESLINGAKHGNVFAYLEKQNKSKRKFDSEDLGLKEEAEE
jgi:ribosomal RNA assembly protein